MKNKKNILLIMLLAAFILTLAAGCTSRQEKQASKAFKTCMDAALNADIEKAYEYVADAGGEDNILKQIENMRASFSDAGIDEEYVDEALRAYLGEIKYKVTDTKMRGSNHVAISYMLSTPDFEKVFSTISDVLKEKYAPLARGDVSKEDVIKDFTKELKDEKNKQEMTSAQLSAVVMRDGNDKWKVDFSNSDEVVFDE